MHVMCITYIWLTFSYKWSPVVFFNSVGKPKIQGWQLGDPVVHSMDGGGCIFFPRRLFHGSPPHLE